MGLVRTCPVTRLIGIHTIAIEGIPYLPIDYRVENRYHALGYRDKTMSKPTDLVQGTLNMLLLKILELQPINGFSISQRLKQLSGNILQVSDGSLYPALHKLEQEGWIEAEWRTTDNNRRAKFYSLTRLGRRHLEKEAQNWNRLAGAISHVVKLEET
jgi:PadR family transcriptional regulator, regulatory protein PadR